MGDITTPSELREFLHPYDPGVQAIGLGLRRVVLEEMAPCHEYIFSMRHSAGFPTDVLMTPRW